MATQITVEFFLNKSQGVDYYDIKTVVKDADGANDPISGAEVVISKMAQQLRSGITDSDGICILSSFVAGRDYTISVEKVGYESQTKTTDIPPN